MSTVVQDIIDDISFRLGDPENNVFRRPVIRRALNRVYKRYNEKYNIVSRETSYTFSQSELDASTYYKTLPDDFKKAYRISPKYEYRDKQVFRNDEDFTYTINLGRIYFSNPNTSATYLLNYYSLGLELVELADGSLTEDVNTNVPEWPLNLRELLFKATCLELSIDYPHAKMDAAQIKRLEAAALRYESDKQATDMPTSGPNRNTTSLSVDPYSNSGYK